MKLLLVVVVALLSLSLAALAQSNNNNAASWDPIGQDTVTTDPRVRNARPSLSTVYDEPTDDESVAADEARTNTVAFVSDGAGAQATSARSRHNTNKKRRRRNRRRNSKRQSSSSSDDDGVFGLALNIAGGGATENGATCVIDANQQCVSTPGGAECEEETVKPQPAFQCTGDGFTSLPVARLPVNARGAIDDSLQLIETTVDPEEEGNNDASLGVFVFERVGVFADVPVRDALVRVYSAPRDDDDDQHPPMMNSSDYDDYEFPFEFFATTDSSGFAEVSNMLPFGRDDILIDILFELSFETFANRTAVPVAAFLAAELRVTEYLVTRQCREYPDYSGSSGSHPSSNSTYEDELARAAIVPCETQTVIIDGSISACSPHARKRIAEAVENAKRDAESPNEALIEIVAVPAGSSASSPTTIYDSTNVTGIMFSSQPYQLRVPAGVAVMIMAYDTTMPPFYSSAAESVDAVRPGDAVFGVDVCLRERFGAVTGRIASEDEPTGASGESVELCFFGESRTTPTAFDVCIASAVSDATGRYTIATVPADQEGLYVVAGVARSFNVFEAGTWLRISGTVGLNEVRSLTRQLFIPSFQVTSPPSGTDQPTPEPPTPSPVAGPAGPACIEGTIFFSGTSPRPSMQVELIIPGMPPLLTQSVQPTPDPNSFTYSFTDVPQGASYEVFPNVDAMSGEAALPVSHTVDLTFPVTTPPCYAVATTFIVSLKKKRHVSMYATTSPVDAVRTFYRNVAASPAEKRDVEHSKRQRRVRRSSFASTGGRRDGRRPRGVSTFVDDAGTAQGRLVGQNNAPIGTRFDVFANANVLVEEAQVRAARLNRRQRGGTRTRAVATGRGARRRSGKRGAVDDTPAELLAARQERDELPSKRQLTGDFTVVQPLSFEGALFEPGAVLEVDSLAVDAATLTEAGTFLVIWAAQAEDASWRILVRPHEPVDANFTWPRQQANTIELAGEPSSVSLVAAGTSGAFVIAWSAPLPIASPMRSDDFPNAVYARRGRIEREGTAGFTWSVDADVVVAEGVSASEPVAVDVTEDGYTAFTYRDGEGIKIAYAQTGDAPYDDDRQTINMNFLGPNEATPETRGVNFNFYL